MYMYYTYMYVYTYIYVYVLYMYMYVCITESLYCALETNTLQINYTSIKKCFLKP